MIPKQERNGFEVDYKSGNKSVKLLSFDNIDGNPKSGIASQCLDADHSSKCDFIEFMSDGQNKRILLIEVSDFGSTLNHLNDMQATRNDLVNAIRAAGLPKSTAIKIAKSPEQEIYKEIRTKSIVSTLTLFYLPRKFSISHNDIMNADKVGVFVAEGKLRGDIARVLDNVRGRLKSELDWALKDVWVMTESSFIENMSSAGF